MENSAAKSSARVRARAAVGKALRGSPAPVQDTLTRTSRKLLQVLGSPPAASSPTDSAQPVWQTPEVPLPDGLTFADVEKALRSWSVNGEPVGHMDGYVTDSKLRFLYTWGLVREDRGRCLELGANPYFTTWLLDEYTDLDLTLANFYGARGESVETVSWLPPGATERREVKRPCVMFNVEEDEFPYPDDSFDVVLFCEMIEHMLMDPLATLRQIHRVLKPNGVMILTTPNVARIENMLKMIHGANIYDPYSGFGPYGRHNREYTRHELHRLLDFAGFEVETSITADGHPSDPTIWPAYEHGAPLVKYRAPDLGHYLYLRARATGTPREGLPSFLYRSWPEGKIVEFE